MTNDRIKGTSPTEAEIRQFEIVRYRGTVNMLNRTKVARIARKDGLSALADAAKNGVRYYAVFERCCTASRTESEK